MFYTKPWADVLIVLLIVVLFFGPKRLPTLGRSLGQGFREFKDGITGKSDEHEEPPALNATQPTQALLSPSGVGVRHIDCGIAD